MAAIIYTAKRKLVPGHTVDTAYSFDVGLKVYTPRTMSNRKDHTSLSGHTESWLSSLIDISFCETVPLLETGVLVPVVWEFLASCMGGETFSLDEWGSVASPVNARNFALVSKDISPVRHGEIRCLSFPFEAREIV